MEDFEQQQKSQGVLETEDEHKQDIRRLMYKMIKDKYKRHLQDPKSKIVREIRSN